jgi:hypothetical protein
MERTCKKCGETKPIEEFVKDKLKSNGYKNICKKCRNYKTRLSYRLNPEKSKIRTLNYRKNNRERYLARARKYNFDHREENSIKNKIRRDKVKKENPEKIIQKRHIDYIKTREISLRQSKIYALSHPEMYRLASKKYHNKVKEELGDEYVIAIFKPASGLRITTIKNNPELIEKWRQQIKIKRLLKQKKNENTETS